MHFMFKGEGSLWLDDNSPFSHYSASITIKSCAVAILLFLKEYLQQIPLICQKLYYWSGKRGCCQPTSLCYWDAFRWSFKIFFSLHFCYVRTPKTHLCFLLFLFLASCTRSVYFLYHERVFGLLLMGTVTRNLFAHIGTASTFLSGRQQWFSGGLFRKSVAIFIYILSLIRIISHFL